jgi:hypothetical protein
VAVAYDTTASTSGTSVSSLSWSHTCTGSSLVLIVDVITANAATSASSVKYNNVSMTSIGKQLTDNQASGGFIERYLLLAPSTGANTVAVTFAAVQDAMIGASLSFTGASQSSSDYTSTTVTNFGSSGTASATVTSPATTSQVIGGCCCGSPVNSCAQTQRWLITASASFGAGCGAGSTTAGTGSNITMSYTVTTDWWGCIGTEIKAPAAAAPASVPYQISQYGSFH